MTFPATPHRPTVAAFLAREIDASGKTQLQITAEVGFDSPNMISMVKQGRTKLPLARVRPLAQALGIDPAHLFRLVMQEYLPDTWAAIDAMLHGALLTENERSLIQSLRDATGDSDPTGRFVRENGRIVLVEG